mmetsp:Transcript_39055/g.63065  ORF Transcript_39055/g.63065 Transcript_39055/m.63065 type:complete len:105 (-) Transcript_39055:17-331(-)
MIIIYTHTKQSAYSHNPIKQRCEHPQTPLLHTFPPSRQTHRSNHLNRLTPNLPSCSNCFKCTIIPDSAGKLPQMHAQQLGVHIQQPKEQLDKFGTSHHWFVSLT